MSAYYFITSKLNGNVLDIQDANAAPKNTDYQLSPKLAGQRQSVMDLCEREPDAA